MAFPGFGKDSGPSTTPRPQASTVNFPRPPSPSPPHPRSPSELKWGDLKAPSIRNYDAQAYQRPPSLMPRLASSNTSTGFPAKTGQIQDSKRTRSPPSTFRADEISKNSRVIIEKPAFSSPVWVNRSKPPGNNNSSLDQESKSAVWTKGSNYQSRQMSQTKPADVPKQTRSPTHPSVRGASPEYTFFPSDGYKRSPIDYRDLDAPEEMPSPPLAFESSFSKRDSSSPFIETENTFSSSPLWANQLKSSSSNTNPATREGLSRVSTTGTSYQSRQAFQTKHTEIPIPKRTRSPTLLSSSDSFSENPEFALDDYERASDFQSHIESSKSGQSRRTNNFGVPANNSLHLPIVKRAKLPLLPSSDQVYQENVDSAQEIERELHAKAKRLARFKDELSQPVQSNSAFKNQKVPAKRQHQSEMEKHKSYEDPTMDVMADLVGRGIVSDYEGAESSSSIVGLCPDMCPESERSERERKGDLDHYERLDGDRNMSSKFLAVKKYTRTAEREAVLIRPMPILEKTMDYLLNLLDQPYNDGFLGLYNFLWDRMRAIRMDLRMQHIFNLKAISMLEQMIRFHILAMHELCEYTKGEGFSEGFDAHLNIEQMNKTSVELFQFYDDHRKKGIHVPSEKEFRGYYALLKLDKHPGYKVEPAELSLDLAKMTPDMRQTPEVFFAREVARACRTSNFIAFFRLARKASYLQACLMHAHFSKLRTQALASLNSGLQINQGIPVNHVAKWLGMEEEDVDDLLDYYGFSVKEFEEPYMVKESALISVDSEYPVKRSKLVGKKRSKTIAGDVLSPSLVDSHTTEGLKVLKKSPEQKPTPLQFIVPGSIIGASEQEMHESDANLSPSNMPKHLHKTSVDLMSQGGQRTIYENQVVPASPLASDFCNSSSENHHIMVESAQKPKYDPVFRNSFGRAIKHNLAVTVQPIMPEGDEEKGPLILPTVSAVNAPIPQLMFAEHLEDEDQTGVMEEDMGDDAETSYYDQEVAEAKLKLVLRIWKRHTAKKKEIREHKRSEANAALSSLSLGPPIWQYKVQLDTYGIFNIDHVTSMRHENQGRSWSVLNPSDVVAAKLTGKNPDAKCLCWKMILCSLEESAYGDTIGPSNESAYSWLQSKFMPANNNGDGDLLVSSPGLAIWKSWIPDQSGVDLICCLSVIKSTTFQDLNNAVAGASAVLFLLSENIPIEIQKNRLDDVVKSLPSGSCLPLLILSSSGKDESGPSKIAKDLGLHDIDKSRVSIFSVSFLKDLQKKQLDGFFSDKRLRGGLEWLASESPPQIIIRGIKTRDLIISHLNVTLKVLDEMNAYRVDPNHCISSFNEALDRSMEEVVTAAHGNPTRWPCPEIDLLEESSDEYRAATWYLPSRGWSTPARVDKLLCALNDSKLPVWEVDMSWLSRGFKISDDVENQKLQLENCLVMYLTEASQMMGIAMAKKEASAALQRCARLELHNSTYHIVPSWVNIFRRVFSWRLMSLTIGEVSSTHVLVKRDISAPTSEIPVNSEPKVQTLLPTYINHPSLDELVEVGCNTLDLASIHIEHQAIQPLSPMASDDDNTPIFSENVVLMENENKEAQNEAMVTNYDHSTTVINNEGQLISSRSARESDKLSELLAKCNIVQNKIDKKLSIYF